ncbi:type IV secretion system protein VirD4 [Devosia sp. UYZn731]|uniref:Ti-type conjugative transfer system protein TraG n=1 Tax=Devosia sp. UYZn731 TaxID=3156345 RepID=UPI003391FAA1
MTPNRIALLFAPIIVMVGGCLILTGIETWLRQLGLTPEARMILSRIGLALPYGIGGPLGIIVLYAAKGAVAIRAAAWGVVTGAVAVAMIMFWREIYRLLALSDRGAVDQSIFAYVDSATLSGGMVAVLCGAFALRVAIKGNAAFAAAAPRRIRGKRAVHGASHWMSIGGAAQLFPETGGIVIGERYRVDQDSTADRSFRADSKDSWGKGGNSPLLCFDGSFGSSHGIAFAGSGGFKTTSITVPTALKWGSGLVILDPSNEVGPLVSAHRRAAGRSLFTMDPKSPDIGFNALDWIGQFGATKEEDIVAVASWIVTDNPRQGSARDDFFRASALQLVTALVADVCLSGHTEKKDQHLRQVRANLAEPEPQLRRRLQSIYDKSESVFVKENVAPFIAMTPETFSGVYANAVKETHWLSYQNYAALVSGSSFTTDELTDGGIDIFINLDLKTLETHPGLARVIIGALMNALYNRNGALKGRTLFLLDEVARLGYLRILETARDAGRKYGITLMLLFQSVGQMREAYGGRDATSKWFESASWISFAAINDPETADYMSKRCGDTTVEVDQVSRSSQMSGSSRTRSRQLTRRPLILPHEVLQMRTDEQIVFTAGNPPLRCGRAIWFRRRDMVSVVGENRFR